MPADRYISPALSNIIQNYPILSSIIQCYSVLSHIIQDYPGTIVGDNSSILMETSLSSSSSQVIHSGKLSETLQDAMHGRMMGKSSSNESRKKRPRLVNTSLDSSVDFTSSPDNTLPRRRKEVSRRNSHELQKSKSSTSVESQTALRSTHASLFSPRLPKLSTGIIRNVRK